MASSSSSISSSVMSHVVQEALIQRTISNSSAATAGGTDASDGLGTRTFSSAMFKKAAVKGLRLQKQHKLMFGDSLKPKNENLLSSDTDSLAEYEEQSNADFLKTCTGSSDGPFRDPTVDELSQACDVALKTHFNLKAFRPDQENEMSMKYIEELFATKIPEFKDKLRQHETEANEMKNCDIVIKCELIRGRGLPASDADGKSDPYCKMVILNKKYLGEKIVEKGDIKSWGEAGVIDKDSVVQSSVKSCTLEPEWDHETFELKLKNPEEEYFVIEVWDSDEEDRKKKIKGIKGFGKFLHDLSNVDDFLGRSFFLLKHLPVDGGEMDLELFSHSRKHKRGLITVKLTVIDKKIVVLSEAEKWTEYNQITKVVMAHESKDEEGEFIRRWSGQLSDAGIQLLNSQASLHGLPKLHESATCFLLLMDYHKSYAVSMAALHQSVLNVLRDMNQANSTSHVPLFFDSLLNAIQELYNDNLSILKIHLGQFSFKSAHDIQELKHYVLTLKCLSESNEFHVKKDNKNFQDTVMSSIQGSVPSWFLLLSANLMPTTSTSKDKILALKALCSHCYKQCMRVLHDVQPVFTKIGIDYFSPFFFALDKVLFAEGDTVLSNIPNDSCSQLICYEIYGIMHDFKEYTTYMDKQFLGTNKLYMSTYHTLFKGFVPLWIDLAQSRAKERLSNAVDLDTVVKYTNQASFSSSAVDAHGMFIQVLTFWKDLDWPDPQQSVGYFANVTQNFSDLAMYYADLITRKVTPDYYTDESGNVVITDKICITLNNIQHVRVILSEIGDEIDLKSYYAFLDQGSTSDHMLSQQTDSLMKRILSSADEDIQEKKNDIVRKIQSKILPIIADHLSQVIQTDIDVPSEKAVQPLLDYISDNMGKLVDALLTQNFLYILGEIWHEVIKIVRHEYELQPHKSSSIPILCRLKDVTIILADFFEAGGNGLSRDQLETKQYSILLKEITLTSTTTQKLIRVFLQDLVKQQQDASDELGILRFGHFYNEEEKCMRINIVSAQNIPALDRSGKSDPFVIIHPLPVDLFTKTVGKTYKTSVKKQTLEPFFNEKFEIPVEGYKLKEEGAVIILAMFDWDKFGSNDFAGICVLSAASVPNTTELKMEHMHLFHYKHTLAYREIEKRSSENLAHDFLKLMKKFTSDEHTPPVSPTHHLKKLMSFTKTPVES